MKIIGVVLLTFVLLSCGNSSVTKVKKIASVNTVSQEITPNPIVSSEKVVSKNDFEILLVSSYRYWEGENPANKITKDWFDLYKRGDKYYLGKADFTIEKGYDECIGESTRIVTSKNKTVLFLEYSDLKLGEVDALKLDKPKIWPKEKITFQYNNINYSIRAEGDFVSSDKILSEEGEEILQDVKNYKLYISTNNDAEILFLEEESFNDSFVELLFVGDIDRDGKLDFIFDASRDYEEERVVLYLSSKAKEGGIIQKVSEISIQFDC